MNCINRQREILEQKLGLFKINSLKDLSGNRLLIKLPFSTLTCDFVSVIRRNARIF